MRKGDLVSALEAFDRSITALDFHLGSYHPLHSTIYQLLAEFYLDKKRLKDALILFKSSLICSLRVLGASHT